MQSRKNPTAATSTLTHTFQRGRRLNTNPKRGTMTMYRAVIKDALPASVPSPMPDCCRIEASAKKPPHTKPPISSLPVNRDFFSAPNSRFCPCRRSVKGRRRSKNNEAIQLRSATSVKGGISAADFCAEKLTPKMNAASSKKQGGRYFLRQRRLINGFWGKP